MKDDTEELRRAFIDGGVPDVCAAVASATGEPIWTTDELRRDFEVLGFLAPLVIVRRRADGVKGSLMFRHQPRIYFGFQAD
jgi:hypothetical protein